MFVMTDEASSRKRRRKAMQWFGDYRGPGGWKRRCLLVGPAPRSIRFVTVPLTRGDVVIDKMNAGIGGGRRSALHQAQCTCPTYSSDEGVRWRKRSLK